MRNEFTAVIEQDGQWFIAYCPEVPGANGQGLTKQEAINSLRDAILKIAARTGCVACPQMPIAR